MSKVKFAGKKGQTPLTLKPMSRRVCVEKVLAIVCCMQEVVLEIGLPNGYQMETTHRSEFRYPRPHGAGTSTSSLFDRYIRGDSCPRGANVKRLRGIAPKSFPLLQLVLWDVMRESRDSHFDGIFFIHELARSLACKVYSVYDRILQDGKYVDVIDRREPTPRLLMDLATQGNEYSLAYLLSMIADRNRLDDNEVSIVDDDDLDHERYVAQALQERQRLVIAACHCLVFMLTLRKFQPIRTALVARLRQCCLDERTHGDTTLLLDRYDFIGIAEEIATLKKAAHASGQLTNSAKSLRRFYRDIFAGVYGQDIIDLLQIPYQDRQGNIHDVLNRPIFKPRAIELEVFRQRRNDIFQIHFGAEATTVLKADLETYWVERTASEGRR